MWQYQNQVTPPEFYVSNAVWTNVKTSYPGVFWRYPLSGQTQTTINSNFSTKVQPYGKYNDVVVLWEGTNDLNVNGLSGADAYANVVTYVGYAHAIGLKVLVCTVIARDGATDAADLMTRIGDYNVLMRANSAGADGVCDLGADAMFDARADCSNATNYSADKIHIVQAGQTNVINLITTSLTTLLASLNQ